MFTLPDVRPDSAQVQHPAVSEYTLKVYAARYPAIKFVGTDTWTLPEEHGKKGVLVQCQCGKVVFRRTSDLHTFVGCLICKGAIRATSGAERKLERTLGMLKALEEAKARERLIEAARIAAAKALVEGGGTTAT